MSIEIGDLVLYTRGKKNNIGLILDIEEWNITDTNWLTFDMLEVIPTFRIKMIDIEIESIEEYFKVIQRLKKEK